MIILGLVPPLILIRFVSLFVFLECLILGTLWIRHHRGEWLYMTPPMLIFTHAAIFYSVYLFDYFYDAHPFSLQFYADWGAFFILHVAFTSLFVLIDLETYLFTNFIARHFPHVVKSHGRTG